MDWRAGGVTEEGKNGVVTTVLDWVKCIPPVPFAGYQLMKYIEGTFGSQGSFPRNMRICRLLVPGPSGCQFTVIVPSSWRG